MCYNNEKYEWNKEEAYYWFDIVNVFNISKMERYVWKALLMNGIQFEYQKKFEWLVYDSYQSLDFYIPSKNVAIECQGKQHYETDVKYHLMLDENKRELCEDYHGVKIIYFTNCSKCYIDGVYRNIDKLIHDIKQY